MSGVKHILSPGDVGLVGCIEDSWLSDSSRSQGENQTVFPLFSLPFRFLSLFPTSLRPQAASCRSVCTAEHQEGTITSILGPVRLQSYLWIRSCCGLNEKSPHDLGHLNPRSLAVLMFMLLASFVCFTPLVLDVSAQLPASAILPPFHN